MGVNYLMETHHSFRTPLQVLQLKTANFEDSFKDKFGLLLDDPLGFRIYIGKKEEQYGAISNLEPANNTPSLGSDRTTVVPHSAW